MPSRQCWRSSPRCTKKIFRSTYSDDIQDSYRDYNDAMPALAVTLEQVRLHGAHEAPWWSFRHRHQESLSAALANPDDHHAYEVRDEEDRRRRQEEEERERDGPVRGAAR
jgi:hypothetical protein